jgi:hypothetical protein
MCAAATAGAAYGIFLAVTLPLVVISLAYVLGLTLYECLTKVRVQRDKQGMTAGAMDPKKYKWFRCGNPDVNRTAQEWARVWVRSGGAGGMRHCPPLVPRPSSASCTPLPQSLVRLTG